MSKPTARDCSLATAASPITSLSNVMCMATYAPVNVGATMT
jgi:hypothetical protein